MRLYLASSFDCAALCLATQKAVEARGHTVPDVWWNVKTKDDFKKASESEFYDSHIVKAIAVRHWRTIDSCDAVILVSDDAKRQFTGANVEVGYAIGKGIPVLIVGPVKRSAMYCPATRCADVVELLNALDIIGGCPR
jgi:nucleoside 2-deoxyribosyltransferase